MVSDFRPFPPLSSPIFAITKGGGEVMIIKLDPGCVIQHCFASEIRGKLTVVLYPFFCAASTCKTGLYPHPSPLSNSHSDTLTPTADITTTLYPNKGGGGGAGVGKRAGGSRPYLKDFLHHLLSLSPFPETEEEVIMAIDYAYKEGKADIICPK